MVPSSTLKTDTLPRVDLAGIAEVISTTLVSILSPGRYFINLVHSQSIGGHAAEKIKIPEGVEVVKVQVGGDHQLNGLRFHLSNGTAGGYLYDQPKARILGTLLFLSHAIDYH
jgi:hypothetical protein